MTSLFAESYGRFLIAFTDERALEGFPCRIIGKVTDGGICVRSGGDVLLDLSAGDVTKALGSLDRIMKA
jgi:hypothetical protein